LNTKVSTEEWKLEENRHKALKGMMGLYKLGIMVDYHVVEMGDLVVLSLKPTNFSREVDRVTRTHLNLHGSGVLISTLSKTRRGI
jgi:hypothetical protein